MACKAAFRGSYPYNEGSFHDEVNKPEGLREQMINYPYNSLYVPYISPLLKRIGTRKKALKRIRLIKTENVG